jgi:hypothetical protein
MSSKQFTKLSVVFIILFLLTTVFIFRVEASHYLGAYADSRAGYSLIMGPGPSRLFLPQLSRVTVYSITGYIQDDTDSPIQNVTVFAGGKITTTTDAKGAFTLPIIAGSYTLTPSKLDSSFTPVSRQVTVPPNASGQDFICTNCEMVTIPAGSFQMGCSPNDTNCWSDERPLHTVYLDAYDIDKNAPGSTGSHTRSFYYGNAAYGNYPVVYVNWNQAVAFCAWEGKRLPTEAEWEKSARGSSDTRIYPWGDGQRDCTLGNFFVNGYCVGDTSQVGSYPSGASPYGALDMAGNVWEWVSDWYQSDYYGSQTSWINPIGPAFGSYGVLRGGSWSPDWNDARVSYRVKNNPANWHDYFGFRCARSR